MILSTDVQSVFHNFGGLSDTVNMVTGAARLKAIHLLPTTAQNAYVELYDDNDTSDLPTKTTAFFSGKQAFYDSHGIWIRIPGNGIRFENGITVKATTSDVGSDATRTVTLVYQGS